MKHDNRGGARPGAGRPAMNPRGRRRSLNLRVAPETPGKLRALAEAAQQSQGQVIDALVGGA